MARKTDHPVFEKPENEEIKIWRYMDFTKYVSMLSNSSLFFSRSDFFEDSYEGATSYANIKMRPEVYNGTGLTEKQIQFTSEFAKWVRQWTYINCWHMNQYESAAMWKLYSKTNEAIAIQSTYKNLFNCLGSEAYVGVVKYIDYEKDWLPEGNSFWPFVHKRRSFEHEKELRAVIQNFPSNRNGIPLDERNKLKGKLVPIDFENLIENVFISPNAPSWFSGLVNEVTKKFKTNVEIKQSHLGKEPIY